MSLHFLSRELRDGLFIISATEWEQPGSSVNCYLVIGDERALLVDTGMPGHGGLRAYVEELAAGRPVTCVCTHGHFDHVGNASEFDEVMMSERDLRWLNGVGYIPGCPITARVLPLVDGQRFQLGNRCLTAVSIPGHTEGSMALLDHQTRTLIAGDAIARRGFFVESDGCVSAVLGLFDRLLEVEQMDFDMLATAHDRFLLPKSLIRHFIRTVTDNVSAPQKQWRTPDGASYDEVRLGEPEDQFYINCSFPSVVQGELAAALVTWKDAHHDIWTKE